MITIQSHERFDREAWKQIVEDCGGNPLHLPEVHLVDQRPEDVRFLLATRGASVVACCTGSVLSKRVLGLRLGRKALSLPTAPAIAETAADETGDVYRAMAAFARDQGCSYLSVGHNWGDDFSKYERLGRWVVDRTIDFTIDLTKSSDDILAAMHKYHRKNIRRAERGPLKVVQDSSEHAVLCLRQLQVESASRATDKGNPFRIQDEDFFRRLHAAIYVNGLGCVLLARAGEQHVAALAYLAGRKRALTVRSGANGTGNELLAMYWLQYDLIIRLKQQGLEILNIGAVPAEAAKSEHPQHGLYQFKRGFGGMEHVRTALRIDLRRAADI